MKITRLKTTLVEVPFDRPIKTALHDMRSIGCVLVELETDEGVIGESYSFTLNAVRLRALHEMILGFRHQVEGRSPYFVEAIWAGIWNEMNPIGHKGFSIAALSALDMACWDLIGKAANLPLHKIFGACREEVRTYASGGLWLSQSIETCLKEADEFINQGFRSMKIRLGSENIAEDVERVREIRNHVGDRVELLSDVNQALSAKQAIRLGRELEEFNLGWLEEPVAYHDLKGHAEVRAALTIPVATGETEYTRYGMRHIIEADAVDILMPDLQRIGGYTEFRRSAALAASHDIPVSSHMFTEHSLCIAASESNCISVEHMPWCSRLFNEEMEIRGGNIVVPDRPGTGFTFDRAEVKKLAR